VHVNESVPRVRREYPATLGCVVLPFQGIFQDRTV